MYKTKGLLSARLFLLALVVVCQILIASADAAAEGPGAGDKRSADRPLNFQAPVAIIDLKARDREMRSAAASLIAPRKGEIFRGTRPAGVEVPASSWPGAGLFVESGVPRLISDPTGTPGTGAPMPNGNQGPSKEKPSTVASTAPMTAGEKFGLFLSDSFKVKPPTPYLLSIVSGVWTEATDYKHKKPHRTAGDFAADSLTHAARSYAFRVTSNFFEKFAYPTAFKQDPRYHRSPYTGFGSRLMYAVTRVFVTQGDRNGKHEFNISFLAGGLTAAGISNLWEPTYHQNAADTMIRFGTHVGIRALTNILSELIGSQ
jgi:hypothetical protein